MTNSDERNVSFLLREILEPSTSRAATEKVKELIKSPEFCVLLVYQLAQNPEDEIRQLSAVLLRKCLTKTWHSLPLQHQTEIKQTLLNRLLEDTSLLVRRSISHVVSSLGKLILSEWKKDLFSFLESCSDSENETHREIAQSVFSSILDSMGDQLEPYYGNFATVFRKGLEDRSGAVRLAATKGVAALVAVAENEKDFSRLRTMIPSLISVIQDACKSGTEDVVGFILEIFDEMAEHEKALRNEDLPGLIMFMLTVAEQPMLSIGIKEQAFNFIHTITKQSPKIITKNNLIDPILNVATVMAMQPDTDTVDDEEITLHRLASQCIDSLALNLPSSIVFEKVIQHVWHLVASANPWERRGALILIGIMSEGCEEVMRHRLNELLPTILSGFTSNDSIVRSAAAICFGQMAEYLQPEIVQSHETTMGLLLQAIQDPNCEESVKEKLCFALEVFCDNLEEHEIAVYLHQLIPVLLHVLTILQTNSARENCIGAIGSAAQAAKNGFEQYAGQVFNILQEAISQTSQDLIPLRARATGCAGCIIQVLPRETFLPYQEHVVELVCNGLETIDHYELREASYRFFGCLSHSLKDDFAPVLPKIMPYIISSLLSSNGIDTEYKNNDCLDLLDGVDSDEDSEDDKRIKSFRVRTGFLDEQETASDLLCCLYRNISGSHMGPWLKQTLDCVENLHKYFHAGVRQTVSSLMEAILLNVHGTYLPAWAIKPDQDRMTSTIKPLSGQENFATNHKGVHDFTRKHCWIVGLPAQSLLHQHTLQLWVEKLWPFFHIMLTEDDDKEVIGDVCRSVGNILEALGPHVLQGTTVQGHDVQSSLIEVILQIFSKKHPCQTFEEEEEIDEDESRAVEEALFEGVSCLISGLTQTMGDQFLTHFSKLNGRLLKLATHKKSSAYRSIGIGCFADIFKMLGKSAEPFVSPVLIPALEGASQSIDISLRRNSAYCLGTIVQIGAHLQTVECKLFNILQTLHPIIIQSPIGMRDAELCVRDNAIAAVGRIIRSCSHAQIPLQDVVPLFLSALPLTADLEESSGIVQTLSYLYFGGCDKAILATHESAFLKALVGEITNGGLSPQANEQAKQLVVSCLQSLGPANPSVQAIANVDPRYQATLTKLMEVNKPFKGSNKKKSSGGRQNLPKTPIRSNADIGKQSKKDRLLSAKQHKEKRLELVRSKKLIGSMSSNHVPPKIVMILPFKKGIDVASFKKALIEIASDGTDPTTFSNKHLSSYSSEPITVNLNSWALATGEGKHQRLTFIDVNPYFFPSYPPNNCSTDTVNNETDKTSYVSHDGLRLVLDIAKTANIILCLFHGGDCTPDNPPFDALGYEILSALKLQGLPNPVGALVNDPVLGTLNPSKKKEKKKLVNRFFESEFFDKKFFSVETEPELKQLVRGLANTSPKEFVWRESTRGFLLAEHAELIRNVDNNGKSLLIVEGISRGLGFTVKHPVHITGIGDTVVEKIYCSRLPSGRQLNNHNQNINLQLVEELTPDMQPALQEEWESLRPFNPLSADQTWPTDEELAQADAAQRKNASTRISAPNDGLETPYQQAWLDDIPDADIASNKNERVCSDLEDDMDDQSEEYKDNDDVFHINDCPKETDAEMIQAKKSLGFELEERSQEDMQFPDEVDTPIDQLAKIRFARYRGLKSFRNSPWDPYEDLPQDYSRIFEYDSFNSTMRYAKREFGNACMNTDHNISLTGMYIRLELRLSDMDSVESKKIQLINQHLQQLHNWKHQVQGSLPVSPLIISTLLPYERKVTVTHFDIHRRDEYQNVLPSKSLVEIQCGFRRFLGKPIFSQASGANSATHQNNKAKFERFLHPGTSAIGSIYAPTMCPPAPILMFSFPDQDKNKELEDTTAIYPSKFSLISGWGTLLNPDSQRVIVKRIVLTGYPFRVHKRKAVIRYMFFNPEDIRWFLPVELSSKNGLRGHIKESLGTHGYMKCIFNDRVNQSDTICMYLYKRVFPKWFAPTWGGDLLDSVTG